MATPASTVSFIKDSTTYGPWEPIPGTLVLDEPHDVRGGGVRPGVFAGDMRNLECQLIIDTGGTMGPTEADITALQQAVGVGDVTVQVDGIDYADLAVVLIDRMADGTEYVNISAKGTTP